MCGELWPARIRRAGKINPRGVVKLSIKYDSAQCAVARRLDGFDCGAGARRRATWYRLTRSHEHGGHNRVIAYLERERVLLTELQRQPNGDYPAWEGASGSPPLSPQGDADTGPIGEQPAELKAPSQFWEDSLSTHRPTDEPDRASRDREGCSASAGCGEPLKARGQTDRRLVAEGGGTTAPRKGAGWVIGPVIRRGHAELDQAGEICSERTTDVRGDLKAHALERGIVLVVVERHTRSKAGDECPALLGR